jgi:hypothetical protein
MSAFCPLLSAARALSIAGLFLGSIDLELVHEQEGNTILGLYGHCTDIILTLSSHYTDTVLTPFRHHPVTILTLFLNHSWKHRSRTRTQTRG